MGAPAATAADRPKEIVIGLGSSRDLVAPPGAAVFVGDGRIVKAVDLGNKIRLTAKRTGATEIRVGSAAYLARVLPLESAGAYERVATAISTLKGLAVEAAGGEIVVKGRLLRAGDWESLAQAAGGTIAFRFAAEIDPAAQAEALELVRRRLAEFQLPEPALRLTPSARASLSPEQVELSSRYEAALKPYGFAVEKNPSVLNLEPLVRVNILIAEVRHSFASQIGVKWPVTATAQVLPSWQPPGTADAPLSVDINAFENSGAGKVLASPNLLCRSGKEAEFFAGGEFPIKVKSFGSQDVIWKRYGVILKVKPRADAQGQMSIAIQTEVSTLDQSVAVDGVPGILANRIESHFDLRRPRTIALSGLFKHETGNSTSGLPGLARIPILGKLFGSEDWMDHKTELVIFVTPEVLPPEKDGP